MRLLSTAILAALPFVGACHSPGKPQAVENGAGATAEAGGGGDEADAEARSSKEHALAVARLELELAEWDAETAEWEARLARQHAQESHVRAQKKLEHFESIEKPRRMEQTQLSLDRATYRAEEAEAELVELQRMYEGEEFAEITKELVLQRGRRTLEMAKRSLELQRSEMASLAEFALPRETEELRTAVAKAGEAVEKADRKLRRAVKSNEKSLMGAKRKLEKAEKELAELDEDEG